MEQDIFSPFWGTRDNPVRPVFHICVCFIFTALNRETRKALLKIVGDELSTAHAVMKSIEPEVNDCQQKVDQKYYDCVQCVDMKCQNRSVSVFNSISIERLFASILQ